MFSYSIKSFLFYLLAALLALLVAAFLPVPALYYPAFAAGIFSVMALIKLLALGLMKWRGDYATSAEALILALLALILAYFLPNYYWAQEAPEPVRLWPLWLAEFQGLSAAAAIFLALDAKSDKASAISALFLAVLALFLLGYHGLETILPKAAGLSVLIGIMLLSGESMVERIKAATYK